MAVVAVAVSTAVLLSIVKLSATGCRTTRTEAWQMQAAWLADSALQRAASRLAADAAYAGETWAIPAAQLTGDADGLVTIEVIPVSNDPTRRQVRVRADYPNDPQHRARQSRQVIVQLPNVTEEAP